MKLYSHATSDSGHVFTTSLLIILSKGSGNVMSLVGTGKNVVEAW